MLGSFVLGYGLGGEENTLAFGEGVATSAASEQLLETSFKYELPFFEERNPGVAIDELGIANGELCQACTKGLFDPFLFLK